MAKLCANYNNLPPMQDSFFDIITALIIFLIPILGFCAIGYGLYRGLNSLLKKNIMLQVFGVILFVSVIAIYLALSGVCIKDVYQMIWMPEKVSLLSLKSFLWGVLYIIFFSELSLRSISGKSIIQAVEEKEKWTYPFIILFFVFLLIGITYTLTMMLGKIFYLNAQQNLRIDILWFLVNCYGLSKFTSLTIRKLGL